MSDSSKLGVHILGGYEGESIVLQLPNELWGVVDSFSAHKSSPFDLSTMNFLRQRNVKELEFLCLTHPHSDHFKGMTEILDFFPVKSFWFPATTRSDILKKILMLAKASAKSSGFPLRIEEADELERIFRKTFAKPKHNGGPRSRRGCIQTKMYPILSSSCQAVEISCLAPSNSQIDLYEQDLSKCFDAEGIPVKSFNQMKHNRISIALQVDYGKTRLILGGDVEKDGWQDLMEERASKELGSHFVKVSHHGSRNSYCDGLWSAHCTTSPPIAAVTSFHKHRLPNIETIKHISSFGIALYTTCQIPQPRLTLRAGTSLGSRKALFEKLSIMPADAKSGRCGFIFDDLGNCTDRQLEGGATCLSG